MKSATNPAQSIERVRAYIAAAGLSERVEVSEMDDDAVLTIDGQGETYMAWDVEAMCERIDAVTMDR